MSTGPKIQQESRQERQQGAGRDATPFEGAPSYGRAYQERQASKYRDRERNHWKLRVDLAFTLARRCALPAMSKPWHEVTVLDVGCSIGTFAIEFAKVGCRTIGLDSDATALDVARGLAVEEGVRPEFVQADVTELGADWLSRMGCPQGVDMVVAFDLFEHLHDDELGALLAGVRRLLSPRGVLIYHTFPTELDHIFGEHEGRFAQPLLAHAHLPSEQFERIAQSYAAWLDAEWIARGGVSHREHIRGEQHCNPLSLERLRWILTRAKFHHLCIERAQLYPPAPPFGAAMLERFRHQPVSHRNLYGAASLA